VEKIKHFVKAALYVCGYYHIQRAAGLLRRPGPRLVVFVYHNVKQQSDYSADRPSHYQIRPEVTAETLSAHLHVVKSLFPVLPLEEALNGLFSGQLERDSAAITFDDGYRSFKHLVLPILQDLNLPATMFLATDYVGQSQFYWWDELNQIIFQLRDVDVDPAKLGSVLGAQRTAAWFSLRSTLPGCRNFLEEVESEFRYMSKSFRSDGIAALRELLPADRRALLRPEEILTWDDVRELSAHSIDWGSHTCSHCGFGDESPQTLLRELEESKATIERETSRRVTSFAYPYGGDGDSYRQTLELVRKSGYQYARTMIPGFNDRRCGRLLLSAAVISGDSHSRASIGRDIMSRLIRTPGS